VTIKNVIIVVVDALRADRIGVYGNEHHLTPNIDILASDSTVFKYAFSCTNATDPSVTSIHTGRHPRAIVLNHSSKITDAEKRRIGDTELLPEVMQRENIRTIHSGRYLGRWHTRGFDFSSDEVGHQSTPSRIGDSLKQLSDPLYRTTKGVYSHLHDLLSKSKNDTKMPSNPAVDTLFEGITDTDTPFYGFVHLMDTHAWYDPPVEMVEELLERYDYSTDDLAEFFEHHTDNPHVNESLRNWATERDYEYGLGRLVARYDASAKQADQKIGRMIDRLEKIGRWDETAFIVTSDHGESLLEHGIYFDHHGLYDESIHVPLIVRVPGADANTVDDLIQLIDIAPTVYDLLKIDKTPTMDGKSLTPHLNVDTEKQWTGHDAVLVEEMHAQRRTAIRTTGWKYIEYRPDELHEPNDENPLWCRYCETVHEDGSELYDLDKDPNETSNVVDSYPDVATEFRERLSTLLTDVSVASKREDATLAFDDEEEVMQRLEELGYR